MSSPLSKAARSTTAPFRNYFNEHFEMVKHEVRTARVVDTRQEAQVDELRAVVADLEAGLVEQSIHHARALVATQETLGRLEARIADLERSIDRLADVVAASVTLDERA